jgi:hypothetical protein
LDSDDFNKTNALKSSLWEVLSLKDHYAAYVSKEIDKLSSLNQSTEFQLDEAFENNSYEALITMELDCNKATANCAINYTLNSNQKSNTCYDPVVSDILKV